MAGDKFSGNKRDKKFSSGRSAERKRRNRERNETDHELKVMNGGLSAREMRRRNDPEVQKRREAAEAARAKEVQRQRSLEALTARRQAAEAKIAASKLANERLKQARAGEISEADADLIRALYVGQI